MHPEQYKKYSQLITILEACRRLSVSRSHFYNLVADGLITIRKVGTASRVDSNELDAYIATLPTTQVNRRNRRS